MATPDKTILVVDDEPNILKLVRLYLINEGYTVECASTGGEALRKFAAARPALIVLDLMLPEVDGWEVCKQVRKESEVPILMLTARSDDVDRIVGLEIGADDYLPKPFNPRELVARIQAILRRVRPARQDGATSPHIETRGAQRLAVGDVEVDTGTRQVWLKGRPVELTNVEYEILVRLLSAAGLVVTREALVRTVLGRELSVFDRSIDMHISHLRKKLGHHVGEVERIKTVRGVGYVYARTASDGAEGVAKN